MQSATWNDREDGDGCCDEVDYDDEDGGDEIGVMVPCSWYGWTVP